MLSAVYTERVDTHLRTRCEQASNPRPWPCDQVLAKSSFVRVERCWLIFAYSTFELWGYWRQRTDERIGDSPAKCIQKPLVVRGKDGRPLRGPLAVHCFCVCSGSALLGGLLGVSRSVECDSVCPVLSQVFV